MPLPQMTRQFVYSIHDLQSGNGEFNAPIPPSWIRSVLEGCDLGPFGEESGQLQVRLSLSGRDVVVRGQMQLPVGVPCARCLRPVRLDIKTDISLLLVPGRPSRTSSAAPPRAKRGQSDETSDKVPSPRQPKHPPRPGFAKGRWSREGDKEVYEFTQEEADMDTYDGDEVVLDELLREMILLEAPIFPLCSEECPGIPATPELRPEPPADPSAVDPRLRPLLNIQTKKL